MIQPPESKYPKSPNSKPLELGDFVCPRYMAKTAEQAIAQGLVYQIIKVNQPGSILTVHRVSDPRTQIIASSDFFISLQEEEGDADDVEDEIADGVKHEVNKKQEEEIDV
jgi:hypothetical protein